MSATWLDAVKWNADGLVPVIAQDASDGRVLMVAWMNREALQLTGEGDHAVYWSRSRQKLWHKGEESGNRQQIKEIRLDCDNDVIVLQHRQAQLFFPAPGGRTMEDRRAGIEGSL